VKIAVKKIKYFVIPLVYYKIKKDKSDKRRSKFHLLSDGIMACTNHKGLNFQGQRVLKMLT
jgi:hypothetical protein